jgi:hypothetical protein
LLSIADKGFHLNPTVAAATLKKMRMEKMSFASAAKQKKILFEQSLFE